MFWIRAWHSCGPDLKDSQEDVQRAALPPSQPVLPALRAPYVRTDTSCVYTCICREATKCICMFLFSGFPTKSSTLHCLHVPIFPQYIWVFPSHNSIVWCHTDIVVYVISPLWRHLIYVQSFDIAIMLQLVTCNCNIFYICEYIWRITSQKCDRWVKRHQHFLGSW